MYQNSEDSMTDMEIVEDMTVIEEEDEDFEIVSDVEDVTMPASEEVEEVTESGASNNPYSYTINNKPSRPPVTSSYSYPPQYYYTPYNPTNPKLVSRPPVYPTYLPPRPSYHMTYPVYYNTYLPPYHSQVKYYYY